MAWAGTFRVSQGFEVWRALGAWVAEHRPAFGPGVAERFHMASQITAAEVWASRKGSPCCVLQVLVYTGTSWLDDSSVYNLGVCTYAPHS